MGKIIAVGGGDIGLGETRKIDEFIVSQSRNKNPKLLIVPTACHNDPEYISEIEKVYSSLGCNVDVLLDLNDENKKSGKLKNQVLSSDIIYVSGGDTVYLTTELRRYDVDKYFRMAYENGTVLSGLSAGALCWFKYGHYEPDRTINCDGWWDYSRPYGFNFINAVCCVHYNLQDRRSFDNAMKNSGEVGIALDNNTALAYIDGKFSVIKSDENAEVFVLCNGEKNMWGFTPYHDQLLKKLVQNF